MPVDYRRFNGPEDSVSYKRFIKQDTRTYKELLKELVNNDGIRKDGRHMDKARSLFARTDMVSQAKGSAYIEMQNTKVVCSVFDPREIPHQNEFSQLGQLHCEVKFAPFSCPRQRCPHAPDAEEKALSVDLRQALEPAVCRHMFPNYQIDVFVYVLENDGACLAAAINAAGLALVDAAVPMYDVLSATSIAIIGEQIFIDPTEEEEYLAIHAEDQNNHGVLTASTLIELHQISNFTQVGTLDVECIMQALDVLEEQCAKIVPNIQRVLVSNVVRSCEQNKHLEEDAKEREKILDAKLEEWKRKLNAG